MVGTDVEHDLLLSHRQLARVALVVAAPCTVAQPSIASRPGSTAQRIVREAWNRPTFSRRF